MTDLQSTRTEADGNSDAFITPLFDNRVVLTTRGSTALTVPHADDVQYWNHINKPEIAGTLVFRGKVQPLHSTRAFFDAIGKDPNDIMFSIAVLDERGAVTAIIGSCGITVDPIRQVGTLGITINYTEHHGKGHGSAAVGMMLWWCFTQLPLRKASLDVVASNEKALAAYTRNGFAECGRRRAEVWQGDRWADLITMEVFRDDWLRLQQEGSAA